VVGEGGDTLIADVSVDLVVKVGVSSQRGWVSGSRGIGVTGVVSTVVRRWVGHVFGGAG
jgi:hypothetical protein